jgi:hypothetical protein
VGGCQLLLLLPLPCECVCRRSSSSALKSPPPPQQGYTKLLHVLGSNVAEFLQNLNNLHLHLSMGWPSMQAPAFRCEAVGPESLLLHYYSSRPGLWPIVVGVLKGMSKTYFGARRAAGLWLWLALGGGGWLVAGWCVVGWG